MDPDPAGKVVRQREDLLVVGGGQDSANNGRRSSTSSGSDQEPPSPGRQAEQQQHQQQQQPQPQQRQQQQQQQQQQHQLHPHERRRPSAPVTYVEVLEHPDVSVGIFTVKKGCSIPLHNHPSMFGIIKCLRGRMDLTSFTALDEAAARKVELPAQFKNAKEARCHSGSPILSQSFTVLAKVFFFSLSLFFFFRALCERGLLFPCRKEVFSGLGPRSRAVFLSPTEKNYHEIR